MIAPGCSSPVWPWSFSWPLTLAGMVVIMAIMDWQFALLALSLTPLLFVIVVRYTRRIKQASRLARHKEGEVTAVAQETFAAMRLVQAFTREGYEQERFRRQNEESLSASLETTTLQAQFAPLVDILVALGTCFIIFAGTERVLQGGLTVGGLLVFLSYLGQMYGPMRQLSKLSAVMSRASASAERIAEIMDTAPEIMDQPGAAAVTSVRGRVEFCDVHFAYTTGAPVLPGIHLCVDQGQTVAHVGQGRQRARVHRAPAPGVRDRHRRAGRDPLGGPAPACGDCPRHDPQRAHPHPG